MIINQIHIKNAWSLSDTKIKFHKSDYNYFNKLNISVIVGENGVGKTTVLKALSYSFFPSIMHRESPLPEFIVNYTIESDQTETDGFYLYGGKKRPSKVIVSSYAVFEPFLVELTDRYANREMYNDIVSNLFSPEEEGSCKYHYCGPMATKQVPSFGRILKTIANAFYGSSMDLEKAEAIQHLMETIGYVGKPDIELVQRFIYKKTHRPFSDPTGQLELRRERLKEFRGKLFSRVERFEDKRVIPSNNIDREFFDFLVTGEEEFLEHRVIKDLWFQKQDLRIPMSKMSSGELSMFYRLFPIIELIENNSLILIDEPETHLHPRWVREYIYNLVKIFGNYNAHVILASHSPMIVSDLPRECIVGLYKNESGGIKQFEINDRTLGAEPSDILQDVFHLEKYQGSFTLEKMNEIKKLLREKEIEQAMAMYHDLGTSAEKYRFFKEIEEYLPRKEE